MYVQAYPLPERFAGEVSKQTHWGRGAFQVRHETPAPYNTPIGYVRLALRYVYYLLPFAVPYDLPDASMPAWITVDSIARKFPHSKSLLASSAPPSNPFPILTNREGE